MTYKVWKAGYKERVEFASEDEALLHLKRLLAGSVVGDFIIRVALGSKEKSGGKDE